MTKQELALIDRKDEPDRVCGDAAAQTEDALSCLGIGVGVFKLSGNLLLPVSHSGAFYSILGYAQGESPEINFPEFLPGQSNLDRSEILAEIRSGNSVEFTTEIKNINGERFCGRILIKPKTQPDMFYIGIIRLDNITVISSEPEEKTVKYSAGKTTADEEFVRSWHDKRYRLLLEGPSVITFDYDSETDQFSMYFTDNKKNLVEKKQLNYIKNIKLNKTSRLDPANTMAEHFEGMLDSPAVREFDVHDSSEKYGYRWYRCKCKSVIARGGRVRHIIGRMDDITVNKSEQAKLYALAEKDGLTGILNRAAMERFWDEYFKKPAPLRAGMLFFIDFDKFKYINDTYGHLVGDQLLRESAKAISKVLRVGDLFCRYGGDEFVVFIEGISDLADAENKAAQIIDAVANVRIDKNIKINCSLGFTKLLATDLTANAAIKRADTALLHAKKISNGSFVYHDGKGVGNAMAVRRKNGKKDIVALDGMLPGGSSADDKPKVLDIAIGLFNAGVFYYYPADKNIGLKYPGQMPAEKENKFGLEAFFKPLLDKKSYAEAKKHFANFDTGKQSVDFTVISNGKELRISGTLVTNQKGLQAYAICKISNI